MNKNRLLIIAAVLIVILSGITAWMAVDYHGKNHKDSIVGTWFVKAPEAPFAYHMFVFNADGTMQQANPDAGDANTSDSDGKGAWVRRGDTIKGKFVEVTADRATHAFVSRGEISFSIHTSGNTFKGDADARFYDANNVLQKGPLPTTLRGERVTL